MAGLAELLGYQPKPRGRRFSDMLEQDFGIDPNVERMSLLPYPQRDETGAVDWSDWVAPQVAVDLVKAGTLPGHAMQGGEYSAQDAAQMVMDTAGSGYAAGLLAPKPTGRFLGMNVWHGGPHKWVPEPDFPHGRPRLDKMGTGEGAQAYGHGFYAAEAPDVAKGYKKNVTWMHGINAPKDPVFIKGGEPWFPLPEEGANVGLAIRRELAAKGPEATLDDIRMAIKEEALRISTIKGPMRDVMQKQLSNFSEAVEKARPTFGEYTPGTLYKLDLPDEDVAKYLDWDAPLSEQPEAVRASLERLVPGINKAAKRNAEISERLWHMQKNGELDTPEWTRLVAEARANRESLGLDPKTNGEELYKQFAEKFGSKEAAAAELRKAGIPGLKYYDGSSRAAGEGTRNFVTWDQDVLNRTKVLERNGDVLGMNAALPMDEASRMARAADMGFDVDAYHYSRNGDDIAAFHAGNAKSGVFDGLGVHSGSRDAASSRAMGTRRHDPITGQLQEADGATYPLKLSGRRELLGSDGTPMGELELAAYLDDVANQLGVNRFTEEGVKAVRAKIWEDYDIIPYINLVEDAGNISYISPPQNIRSRFAAFDPAKAHSSDLLAATGTPAALLGPRVTEERLPTTWDELKAYYRRGGA